MIRHVRTQVGQRSVTASHTRKWDSADRREKGRHYEKDSGYGLYGTVFGAFVSVEHAAAADRFVNNNNGTVTDTQTGLMGADHDSGYNINWFNAESYCKGHSGGGKYGWRMPTIDELTQLCRRGAYGSVIVKSGWYVWSSETRDSKAAVFDLGSGYGDWLRKSSGNGRALPVRSAK